MDTYMLYQAQRPKTVQEQRELDATNGEIASAIMRPVRWLGRSRLMDRPVTSFTGSARSAAPSGHPRDRAARAGVLPISQSRHLLEGICLEFASQDQKAQHRRLPVHAPK
jgi:hypothetical protein